MLLPSEGKLLALDLGMRRTGVALTDAKQRVVFVREEWSCKTEDELFLLFVDFLKKEKIVGILVGYPLNLDGQITEQTEWVEKIIMHFGRLTELPIQKCDERFSTEAAKKYKKGLVDSEAAQWLLETYLESRLNSSHAG